MTVVVGPGMPGNRLGEGVRNLELAREEERRTVEEMRRAEPRILADRGHFRWRGVDS